MDVIFSEYDTFQPDVIYVVKDREEILGDWIHGVPSLVVEVISPSSNRRDRKLKFNKFLEYGVPEYWLFDPLKETVEIYLLAGSEYRKHDLPDDTVPYRSPLTPEIEFSFADLWRKYRHKVHPRK
jgi:Uma2 family endonuclease